MNKYKLFIMLLVLTFSLSTVIAPSVFAYEGFDENIAPSTYEHVYFISDATEFSNYKQTVITTAATNKGFLPNEIDFLQLNSYNAVINYFTENVLENSIVIVELTTDIKGGIYTASIQTNNVFSARVSSLTAIFQALKTNGCMVMLVAATDEDSIVHYEKDQNADDNSNKFLDYVDVYVNVDFKYMLVKGMVYQVEGEDGSGTLNNSTVIFDSSLTAGDFNLGGHGFLKDWFYEYVDAMFYAEYEEAKSANNQLTYDNFLTDNVKLQVYVQNSNTNEYKRVIHDVVRNNPQNVLQSTVVGSESIVFNLENENDPFGGNNFYEQTENIYFMGMGNQSKVTNTGWFDFIEYMLNIENVTSIDENKSIKSMHYLVQNIDISRFLNEEDFLTVGQTRLMFYGDIEEVADGIYTFEDIVTDFIYENDLNKYNNTASRCDIAYTPMLIGDSGWIPVELIWSSVTDYLQ